MEFTEQESERLITEAKKSKEVDKVLRDLFPSVFRENDKFINIGVALKRKSHPNCVYAIFKQFGKVVLLNITHSTFWEGSESLEIGGLFDREATSLTLKEFRLLTGNRHDQFTVIE